MICPKCQTDLADNSDRCFSCGHLLQSDAVSPPRDATRPFQSMGEPPPTKIAHEKSELAATKISSTREAVGITKVHVEPPMTPTKVAVTKPMEPTKVFGQAEKPSPFHGWLVVLEGKQQWSQFIVPQEEGRYFIGSAEDCAFMLDDQDVEPHHASLRLKESKLHLTDLDTARGTQVKEQNISKVELQDGDEIKIGSTVLRFRKL